MSQSSGSSSETPRKERIIPITIEGEETPTTPNLRSSQRLSLNKPKQEVDTPSKREVQTPSKREVQTPIKRDVQDPNKQIADSSLTSLISEDSSSAEESNVCASIKSLSITTRKQRNDIPDVSSLESIVDIPQRTLPSCNVPEKIIIVLDRALDENYTSFEMNSGKKYSPLFMLEHALKIFLHNKTAIDNKHEFALIALNENSATWIHDFSNSPLDILQSIQSFKECEPEDIFDLNTVFDLINKNVEVSPLKKDMIPPLSIVRTVLLYGRSYSIPELTRTQDIEKLLNSPYFTVDVVMTHEPPSSANHCDKIYKALQEIDTKGFAYSFSVSRSASDLHGAMAKILSHPLQRPHQSHAKYNINSLKL